MLLTACGDDDVDTHEPKPKPNKTTPTTNSTAGEHTHSFGEWVIVKDYTCTEDGLQERLCDCGEREEQVNPTPGHIPSQWIIEKEATATEAGCTRLDNVIIPDSVTSIGQWAFENCTKLYNFTVSDNVTYIGSSAFKNTGYYNTASNWENDVLYVGSHLVAASQNISGTCVVREGTRTICAYAFSDCTGLTGITFPDSLIAIYDCAFMRCSGLTSITIPGNVSEIRSSAFYSCEALSSISIHDKPIIMDRSAFSGTAYEKDPANWDGDVLYVGNHLMYARENFSGNYVIRPGTRTICDYAFSGRTDLTGIVIPESVGYIGTWAFNDCSKLTELVIPDSVTLIGSRAFSLCSDLTNIVVPLGVTELAYGVFFRCYDLTSVTIPHSVTSIVMSAFDDCYSLKDIYYTGTIAQWEAIAKEQGWDKDTGNYIVHCTDGDIAK